MDEPENAGRPPVVDRAAFQAELDALRMREKAHTREGDAIAAARRRLPMAEVDASLTLTGPDPQWPGGRPIPQWPRLDAGRSGDLGTAR